MMRWHPLHVLTFAGRIRPPEGDETPLSSDECWVAIRDCIPPNFGQAEQLDETGPRGEAWL